MSNTTVRDDHPGEPITKLEDVRARHNVVAAVADLDQARTLIESLGKHRIEGTNISLLGAYRPAPGDDVDPAAEDDPATSAAKGSAAGAVIGAGLGAATATVLAIPGVGPVIAGGLWAVLGGTAGAIVGAANKIALADAWEHTFEAVRSGNFAVGVHSDDPEDVERAEHVMMNAGPLAINRFVDTNDITPEV